MQNIRHLGRLGATFLDAAEPFLVEKVYLLGVLLVKGFLKGKQSLIDRNGRGDLLELSNTIAIVGINKIELRDVLRNIVLRTL